MLPLLEIKSVLTRCHRLEASREPPETSLPESSREISESLKSTPSPYRQTLSLRETSLTPAGAPELPESFSRAP